jgi:hypothetical protein
VRSFVPPSTLLKWVFMNRTISPLDTNQAIDTPPATTGCRLDEGFHETPVYPAPHHVFRPTDDLGHFNDRVPFFLLNGVQ